MTDVKLDVKLVLTTEYGAEVELITSHVDPNGGKPRINVDIDGLILNDGVRIAAAMGLRGINQAMKKTDSGEISEDNPRMQFPQGGPLL